MNKEKIMSFLSYPILSIKNLNNDNEKIIALFENEKIDFLQEIIKQVGNKYKNIIILRSLGLGENVLLNYYIDDIIESNKINDLCLVCFRDYREIMSLFNKIPCYYLPLEIKDYAKKLDCNFIKFNTVNFFIYHCTIYQAARWVKQEKLPRPHFCDFIKILNNIKRVKSDLYPVFNDEFIQKVIQKCSFLNLEKFIFLVPEANGTKFFPETFWIDVYDNLSEKGYDVYVNTSNGISSYGKSTDLSMAEACYLATLAKGIIGLRCGFMEFIASTKSRNGTMHIIYHNSYGLHDKAFYEAFKIKEKYPFVNLDQVYEYIMDNNNLNQIFDNIMNFY